MKGLNSVQATEKYYQDKILELELKIKSLEAEIQFLRSENFKPFPG